MEFRFEDRIAFSPIDDARLNGEMAHVQSLYDDMMGIFDNELAPIINHSLTLALMGEYRGDDVIEEVMEELVTKNMARNILHDYLAIYNTYLRAIEGYASQTVLRPLFVENGFRPRQLFLYWFPYYTRNLRNGPKLYFRAKSMLQTLSVSFVLANEMMCLCQYASSIREALKYAYKGSSRLQFTWADYFNYLNVAHSSVATTIVYNVISMMLKSNKTPTNNSRLTAIEKEGAMLAELAYGKRWNPNSEIVGIEDAFGIKAICFPYKNIQCLSFAGTRIDFTSARKSKVSVQNILTDVIQIAYKPTPAYLAAVGVVEEMLNRHGEMHVFGHSLGGGLTQFACAANSTTKVHGYGYNSAGLSAATCDILTKHGTYVPLGNIVHVNASTDAVSKIGTFLGERKVVDTAGMNMLDAHKIENLIRVMNGMGS